MGTDYSEKEREFLDALKEDTGRDLGEWMAAIESQALSHRNDIIDWLRQQGFMFSKASWLERIHHNGGRPIYAGRSEPRPQARNKARTGLPRHAASQAPAEPDAEMSGLPLPSAGATTGQKVDQDNAEPREQADLSDPAALDEILVRAKAYRPLAQLVLAEITRSVPSALARPVAQHIEISTRRLFAVLLVGSRELRLGLDLGPRPFDETCQPFKPLSPATRISPNITHMLLLTDARQVNAALKSLVKDAAERKD